MADDTVQQIVPGASSSAINAHPSLIQRRSPERRRTRDNRKEQRDDDSSNDREKRGTYHGDTVTLSTTGKPDVQGNHSEESGSGSQGPSSSSRRKIDIRI